MQEETFIQTVYDLAFTGTKCRERKTKFHSLTFATVRGDTDQAKDQEVLSGLAAFVADNRIKYATGYKIRVFKRSQKVEHRDCGGVMMKIVSFGVMDQAVIYEVTA